MRYLVLSDIHSNIEALDACGERALEAGYDAVLCCGDIVGYGPNPCETIERMQALNAICIRGNHDRVAAGLGDADAFSTHAQRAIYWTRDQLTDSDRNYLAELPVGPRAIGEDVQLAHGALSHEDDYLLDESEAFANFLLADRRITFFGHTHLPVVYAMNPIAGGGPARVRRLEARTLLPIDSAPALLVNPGSVGQPRDGDPRAAFAIWDDIERSIEFYRVEYPFTLTQSKMRAARLPPFLVDRLARGR